MKKNLLLLFRWIVYIPLIFTVPSVLLSIASVVGQMGPWWIWFIFYSTIGWGLAVTIMYWVASICPTPKYPNLLFLGFFIVAESYYLYLRGPGSSALEVILRLGTDLMIIIGISFAAFVRPSEIR